MDVDEEKIAYIVNNTEVLRSPMQALATFGTTNIYYYMITEPSYSGVIERTSETVIREGRVIAERPRVVTPAYLVNLEGFSQHARRYLEMMSHEEGRQAAGILYRYKNEHKELNIVSDSMELVVQRLNDIIDQEGDPLSVIIRGVDEMWDVSLMKFIHDLTMESLPANLMEMNRGRLLDIDKEGVPRDARVGIEVLFDQVRQGDLDPTELKMELDRWGLFEQYQDRFLGIFRKTS